MNEQEIRDIFLEQLPESLRQIEAAWDELCASSDWGENDRAGLIHSVHRLAGAALSAGYSRMGNAARQIENQLKQSAPADRQALAALVAALLAEIRAGTPDSASEQAGAARAIQKLASLHETRSASLIYMADDDPVLAEALASQLRHFGYHIQTFTHLQDLRPAIQREFPAAVLMDIMFPEGKLAGLETVRDLQAEYHDLLPVFFLSVRDDMATRLQAIRSGGKNYFVKPVDVGALVDELDKVVVAEAPEQYRVLIVDDSDVQAKVNAMHLAKAGIDSIVITNPMEVLNALEEYLPDLLLLDLYMPECTGLELAQAIRQIKTFVSLPIVYLSAETDREKQLLAVGIGGDDFLTKPIRPDHLTSAVASRIQRYRELRALMVRDSLTGLFNHTSIRERLGQEIARSARVRQPLALAMIDIDHFKKVNDAYGHATGDRVLKALTHMLTRRLRQSDIVGRYGGEEFVVILPNTDQSTALQVLDELRAAFALVQHSSRGEEFCVTFSCGVASFPAWRTAVDLSEAADRALYAAKRQGRNQVVLAE